MALDQTEHLPLEEFLRLFEDNLLDIEEFLVGCQRYPDFYRRIEPLLSSLPLVSHPEEARTMLLDQVVDPFLDPKQTPEQIRHQAPDEALPLREVIRRSEDLKKVLAPDRESRLQGLRETFASRLVDKFIEQSKLHVDAGGRDGLVRALEPALDATVARLIANPRQKPELALAIAGELITQQPALAPQKAADAAMAHSLTLEVLAGRVNDPTGAGLRTFFQANARGMRQIIAPVGDFVFRMMPKNWRVEIIEDQIAKSFDRVTKKLESAGIAITDSPVFASYLNRARQYQQGQQSALSGVAKIRNAVADVFTTVFGSPDRNIEIVYEAGKRGRLVFAVERWEGVSLLAAHYAGLSQKAPNLFGLVLNEAGTLGLSYALRRGAGAVGEKLAGSALGKALGGLFGSAGGPVGAIVGSVVFDKALGFISGIFKGVFSFFNGEFFARLFAGTKTDWKTDLPLLLSGGAVLAIVLLFVFPWFFNPQFMYDLATKTPLAINSAGAGAGAFPSSPGTCEVPTSGWCAVDNSISNIGRVFGAQAQNAAMVCNKESGYMGPGAAMVVNDSCLPPGLRQYVNASRPSTADYSIGLFQINMLTQGELAFQSRPEGASLKEKLKRAGRGGKNCYDAFSDKGEGGSACVVADEVLLAACRGWFQDPVNNMAYAIYLYSRRGWQPWSTARACGLVQ
ncbi:hypothetical protein HY950_00240 [Candidatus Gottesmanbacteria bacterium]|nr:hypothetical protein [Candidatus Gottesmanbacteria bacterium]